VARDEPRTLEVAQEKSNDIDGGLQREPSTMDDARKPKEVTGGVVVES
jgi:hypothetical protein